MKVDLFIHGVPKGQDFWGLDEDRNYFSTFYTKSDENVKMVVEARKCGTKNYVYYTYLKYNNVVDADSRAGAYVGVSLRFDAYCMDVLGVYRLLETVYNRNVAGTLLQDDGNRAKFIVSNFSQKDAEIKLLQNEVVMKLLQLCFSQTDFVPVDDTFIHTVTTTPSVNLADCDKAMLLATLKRNARVAVSPQFPSAREMALQKEDGGKLSALKAEMATRVAELATLKHQLDQQNTDLQKWQEKYKAKEDELQHSAVRKEVSQLVGQIKEPISKLAACVDSTSSAHSHRAEPQAKPKAWWKIIVLVLNGISVLLLCLLIWMSARKNEPQNSVSSDDLSAPVPVDTSAVPPANASVEP